MAYKLELTSDDFRAIEFASGRYSWSNALSWLDIGENDIAESEAWNIVSAFEEDCEGGHLPFPLLNPESELYEKLQSFWDGVV